MRDPKLIQMINNYYIKKSTLMTGKLFSKTALFAKAYKDYLEENNNHLFINDEYGTGDSYDLYVFNPDKKIYEVFEEIAFKKNFIEYVKSEFTLDEFSSIDLSTLFSNGDLSDIYELIKVYSEYVDFDIYKYADNGHLITNINNKLFDVSAHEFVEWKDEYIKTCPLLYRLMFDGTDEEVINIFNSREIYDVDFKNCVDDFEDDIIDGYSTFDLIDVLANPENMDDSLFDEEFDDEEEEDDD